MGEIYEYIIDLLYFLMVAGFVVAFIIKGTTND